MPLLTEIQQLWRRLLASPAAGVAVESINCEFTEPSAIQAAVENVMDLLSALPRWGSYAYLNCLWDCSPVLPLAGVFGSYGWSGEAVDEIESKLQNAGYRFGFETIRVKNPLISPSNSAKKRTDLAQALKKAKKIRPPANL